MELLIPLVEEQLAQWQPPAQAPRKRTTFPIVCHSATAFVLLGTTYLHADYARLLFLIACGSSAFGSLLAVALRCDVTDRSRLLLFICGSVGRAILFAIQLLCVIATTFVVLTLRNALRPGDPTAYLCAAALALPEGLAVLCALRRADCTTAPHEELVFRGYWVAMGYAVTQQVAFCSLAFNSSKFSEILIFHLVATLSLNLSCGQLQAALTFTRGWKTAFLTEWLLRTMFYSVLLHCILTHNDRYLGGVASFIGLLIAAISIFLRSVKASSASKVLLGKARC
eukprot:TRINITY_DN4905_c0_g1_i1.p1 TRINITY_DN4905_c0_g1~~TRINITY_DN4905_c0_g1_i1.p1  ORF type:complete len:283 (+),score=48.98 TRINITY_DN4905_c0_g1_i1:62-910(+)